MPDWWNNSRSRFFEPVDATTQRSLPTSRKNWPPPSGYSSARAKVSGTPAARGQAQRSRPEPPSRLLALSVVKPSRGSSAERLGSRQHPSSRSPPILTQPRRQYGSSRPGRPSTVVIATSSNPATAPSRSPSQRRSAASSCGACTACRTCGSGLSLARRAAQGRTRCRYPAGRSGLAQGCGCRGPAVARTAPAAVSMTRAPLATSEILLVASMARTCSTSYAP